MAERFASVSEDELCEKCVQCRKILFVVWVPRDTGLLQFGSDDAGIGRFTYFPRAAPEISLDEPQGSTRLASLR